MLCLAARKQPSSIADSTAGTIAAPLTSGPASPHKPFDRRKGGGGHLLEVAVGELGAVGGVDVVAADGPGVHHHAVASDGAAQTVPYERAQKHPRCHLGPYPDRAKLHTLWYIRQERLREEARTGLSFTSYTSSLCSLPHDFVVHVSKRRVKGKAKTQNMCSTRHSLLGQLNLKRMNVINVIDCIIANGNDLVRLCPQTASLLSIK